MGAGTGTTTTLTTRPARLVAGGVPAERILGFGVLDAADAVDLDRPDHDRPWPQAVGRGAGRSRAAAGRVRGVTGTAAGPAG